MTYNEYPCNGVFLLGKNDGCGQAKNKKDKKVFHINDLYPNLSQYAENKQVYMPILPNENIFVKLR